MPRAVFLADDDDVKFLPVHDQVVVFAQMAHLPLVEGIPIGAAGEAFAVVLAYELAIGEQILAHVLAKPSESLLRSLWIGLNERDQLCLSFQVPRTPPTMDVCAHQDRVNDAT